MLAFSGRDVSVGRDEVPLAGHVGPVTSVAFTPDEHSVPDERRAELPALHVERALVDRAGRRALVGVTVHPGLGRKRKRACGRLGPG